MKIHTRVVTEWSEELQKYVVVEDEFYEYNGPVAEAKSGDQTSTTDTRPWSEQQPYLQELFGAAQDFYNRGTPDTRLSTDRTNNLIRALDVTSGNVGEQANQYYQKAQGMFNFLDPASNPAFSKYLDLSNSAITKAFNEGVMPGITSNASMTGNVGSARHGIAQGIAAGNLLNTLQNNTAQLTNQAYGQGLDMYKAGMSYMPTAVNMSMMPTDIMGKAATLQNTLDTQDYAKQLQLLQAYQGLIGGNYGGTSIQTTPMSSGGLAGALGGMAATGGIMSAFGPGFAAANPWTAGLMLGGGAAAGYL